MFPILKDYYKFMTDSSKSTRGFTPYLGYR
ncbi:MAG: hypothetical protein JWM69_1498, partial [Candidatus Binatus sp.]|nr:hypothetical protein [Candidatus Binatus sp.]